MRHLALSLIIAAAMVAGGLYAQNGNQSFPASGPNLAAPGPIGGTTPGSGAFTTLSASGQLSDSAAGGLSTGTGPAVLITGAPATGGTGTTTVPFFYLNSGIAPSTWASTGTYLGFNAPSGYTGNMLDLHVNGGASIFRIGATGAMTVSSSISSISLIPSGSINDGNNGHIIISLTGPTIAAAGCGGAAASIPANNGTASFTVNVGTTNTGTCTITMPAAATGWACQATDVTTNSTTVFITKMTSASNATTLVLQNYTDVAGTAAWVDSDVLEVHCAGN